MIAMYGNDSNDGNEFKILPFVRPSGNGYDLPKGCIVQMDDELFSMNSDTGRMEVAPHCNMTCLPPKCMCHRFVFPRFVYWNPNGAGISNDKYIRTLCYNPHKAMDGTDMFFEYQKYEKDKYINITLNVTYITIM